MKKLVPAKRKRRIQKTTQPRSLHPVENISGVIRKRKISLYDQMDHELDYTKIRRNTD